MKFEPLKITQIGNSLGIILPKEMLNQMNLTKGDELFALPNRDGFQLSAANPEFARQWQIAQEVMKEYSDVFRELADK